MLTAHGEQSEHIAETWGCGRTVGYLFVGFNLVLQLGPCAAILARNSAGRSAREPVVRFGVAALLTVLAVQVAAYSMLWSFEFVLRNVAVAGALVLVYAETAIEQRSSYAGLPSTGTQRSRADWLILFGRLFCTFMFGTMLRFDSVGRAGIELLGLGLMACVAVGYSAKLASVALFSLLAIENLVCNAFFLERWGSDVRDFKKYDFFQTLSVMGGLLLIVAYGPGGVSLDERKGD